MNRARLVVLACCLQSSLLQAQTAADLRYLVFDAVPIAVSSADASGAARSEEGSSLQIRELTTLPQSGAVELQQWLQTNIEAAAVPGADPLSDAAGTSAADIDRYEALVREIEINEGPFAAQLPQQLLSLGSALQASGDLETAQDYFEQATHITRVNHGLFSPAQIPFIKYSIDNQLRQGKLLAADEQQRYLFYLNQKNHRGDSTALLPALEDFAEWNIYAFSAPITVPAPLPTGDTAEKTDPADEALFRVERLISAQNIYWSIAQILVTNFGLSDPRLLDAEQRIALTNYFFATTIAAEADTLNLSTASIPAATMATGTNSAPLLGNMGYRQGRDALERRRNYMREMPGISVEQRLRASLDLTDWMLYFSRQRMKAIEQYTQDHAEFAAVMPSHELDAVLSPSLPQQLPAFIHPAWSRASLGLPDDVALQYKGHIDVEFVLNRFGRVTKADLLGRSNPDVKLVEQRLLRSLRRAQFRPRFENGQLKTSDRIQARYYYTW